jgi:hypothetical protein
MLLEALDFVGSCEEEDKRKIWVSGSNIDEV